MLSAKQARENVTMAAYTTMIDKIITEESNRGKNCASMLIPSGSEPMVRRMLEANGYRVVSTPLMTGHLVTAHW